MRKTGELFILRTNINTVGSVLDSPVRLLRPSFACVGVTLTSERLFAGVVLGMQFFYIRVRLFSADINERDRRTPICNLCMKLREVT
jgi:hypothetical protein